MSSALAIVARATAAVTLAVTLFSCRSSSPPTKTTKEDARPGSVPAAGTHAATGAKLERDISAFGTRVYLATYPPSAMTEAAALAALDAAIAEMKRLEGMLSEWQPESDVGRVNQHSGGWVAVAPETWEVVERGLWASRISDGVFDITFQAMHDLWKFGTASDPVPRVPAASDIRRRRALIDYRKVELDEVQRRIRIGAGQAIGLGGIAKGFIVDRAVAVLRRAGLSAFLVQAGGDLYGAGTKPDGSPWVSGIRDPRGPAEAFFATLQLTDHAFSTAGDYARAYVVDGRRYHHIIDPRTGYPASGARSVTVWAPDAFTADAIDDAIFILGPERGLALARELPGVGVVLVDSSNRVHISPILEGRVHVTRPPTDGI